MRGQDHLTFGELVEFLACSPAKVAGVPQVVVDEAAVPPVAADKAAMSPVVADEAAAHPGIPGLVRKLEDPPMRSVQTAGIPRLAYHKAAVPALFREPAESVPEPALFREPAESAPEPALFREPAESAPEPALFREPAESTPEPALFHEPTESTPGVCSPVLICCLASCVYIECTKLSACLFPLRVVFVLSFISLFKRPSSYV